MAVRIVINPNQDIDASPKHYFGLSTDIKPTVAIPGTSPPPTVGSDFIETDTQLRYLMGNDTNWIMDPNLKAMIDLKDAINALKEKLGNIELDTEKIRIGHELHLWGEAVEVK